MKCRLCNNKAIPGKVYCRRHVHGNENYNHHSYRYGTLNQKDEDLPGHRSDNKARDTQVSGVLRKQDTE